MEELISTFHIDWKLMIAQIVNFGIVFGLLYWLAAKPLAKLMKDRTKEITDGLENAEKAQLAVENANLKKEEIVKEAKNNAKQIITSSEMDGKEIIKEAKEKALLEKEEVMKQTKIEAEKEKKNIDEQIRKESAVLIEQGVKKIMENYVAAGKGDELIKGMLKN